MPKWEEAIEDFICGLCHLVLIPVLVILLPVWIPCLILGYCLRKYYYKDKK